MLEGLEAAEILLSGLERTFRIDAEFFNKTFLNAAAQLAAVRTEQLKPPIVKISDGNHFSISDDFQEEGIPYYRGQDVTGHFFIEQAQPVCIPPKAFSMPHMRRSHLNKGDVLLSIVGTIGELSLVSSRTDATCSCKLAILRPQTVKSGYLAVFLKSRYGQDQIHRLKRGAVQMGLLLEDMDQLKIARFSPDFENAIEEIVQEAKARLDGSVSLYQQTEQTLLRALGLDNWHPPEPLTYQRKAREAVIAGRLDSEYFSPRVQSLIAALSSQKRTVGDVAKQRKDHFSPAKHDTFEYIEISDVTASGEVNNRTVPSCEAPDRATWHVRKGDVITSTVRPIRRLSALIHPNQDGFVCSSGFAVLKPIDAPTELLLAYLRLPVIAELMDLHTTASLYPAISVPDILSIPFLKPDDDVIVEIVQAVQLSHAARNQAHVLLDRAKRAVAIAIEENEREAIEYLQLSKES